MEAAPHLAWLASYPKSGNTWVRLFLGAYLDGVEDPGAEPLRTNTVGSRATLDALLGVDTADLTAEETRALLPTALRGWAARAGLCFVKTHDAFGYTSRGEPLFPSELTRAVIHVVRDPRDVVISWHHHLGDASLERTIARLNDGNAWIARGRGAAQGQVPQFVSDWSGHARGWLASPLPRLTVRYEDLLADPSRAFRRILTHCELDVDEARLAHAVAVTSFERLQALERARGFRERPPASTAPFFRTGRAGGWRSVLGSAQVAAIEEAHGAMMDVLGYAR